MINFSLYNSYAHFRAIVVCEWILIALRNWRLKSDSQRVKNTNRRAHPELLFRQWCPVKWRLLVGLGITIEKLSSSECMMWKWPVSGVNTPHGELFYPGLSKQVRPFLKHLFTDTIMRHADTVYGTLANMNEADFFRQEQPNIVGVLLLHKQIQIQYKMAFKLTESLSPRVQEWTCIWTPER